MCATETRQLSNQATLQKAREYIVGGALTNFTLPDEVAFAVARGKGCRVWDADGRSYIDLILGSGPMVLGHSHPSVVEAVKRQAELGSTFYVMNQPIVELAEKIVEAVPCAELVKFVNTGTEATYYALRLARAYAGRDKVLKFEGGYHGGHDYSTMSQTPARSSDSTDPVPDSAGIPGAVADQVLVAPFNDIDRTCSIIREHAGELAAVIMEPLQRTICPKPGFLEAVRAITKELGIVLIFDEVVTGFRLAYGGAQEYYGVVPDLATYGKIIGGGYPIGAIAGGKEIMSLCDAANKGKPNYVFFSGTFSGNPITAVAGVATLSELQRAGTYERLRQVGKKAREGLVQIADRQGIAAQVAGDGPIFQLFLTDQEIVDYRATISSDSARIKRLGVELIRRGVLSTAQKCYLSLAHGDKDLDEVLNVFEDSLKATRSGK